MAPLSDGGRVAAENLAAKLQLLDDVYVVSSDEVKAQETASALSDRIVVDSRVREVSRPWTEGDYKSIARDWLSGEMVEGWEPLKRQGWTG